MSKSYNLFLKNDLLSLNFISFAFFVCFERSKKLWVCQVKFYMDTLSS